MRKQSGCGCITAASNFCARSTARSTVGTAGSSCIRRDWTPSRRSSCAAAARAPANSAAPCTLLARACQTYLWCCRSRCVCPRRRGAPRRPRPRRAARIRKIGGGLEIDGAGGERGEQRVREVRHPVHEDLLARRERELRGGRRRRPADIRRRRRRGTSTAEFVGRHRLLAFPERQPRRIVVRCF